MTMVTMVNANQRRHQSNPGPAGMDGRMTTIRLNSAPAGSGPSAMAVVFHAQHHGSFETLHQESNWLQ